MDNATKDFAHKILSQLEKISHVLSIGPPGKHNGETETQADQSGPKPPETPRKSSVIPPAPQGQSKTDNPHSDSSPWWRGAQIVGIGAAIAVAWINGCQWKDANRNFRVDQRPWLKLELVPDSESGSQKVTVNVTIGKILSVPIRVKNIGKTPAGDVRSAFAIQIAGQTDDLFLPPDMTNPPHAKNPKHWTGVTNVESGSIFPDQFHDLPVSKVGGCPNACGPSPIDSAELGQITGGALIYIAGTVTYTDGFGIKHWTRFCTSVPATGNGKQSCIDYNRADSNY